MTYSEAVQWLYSAVPNFQRDGGTKNYKIGLEGPEALWQHLGFPGEHIPTLHVAGTNGKGSTVHMLASGMKEMGLKVGVFSSPHLFNFRERAKIGTEMVPETFVADFVAANKSYFKLNGYSFFELTLMLSLQWFEAEQVDWIILETGMGGRLDATNICSPELSLITNIGLDHVQWLGNTRPLIAREKAGIIKPGVPVIIVQNDEETRPVFIETANEQGAPLFWAKSFDLETDLKGTHQRYNLNGAATALELLFPEFRSLWTLGLNRVIKNTAFAGRWMEIGLDPLIICDTGHNADAFQYLVPQAIDAAKGGRIHWILGSAGDKDFGSIIELLPTENSTYYWTSASSPRCAKSEILAEQGSNFGRYGNHYPHISNALSDAKQNAGVNDLIFIGGSTFVVADLDL